MRKRFTIPLCLLIASNVIYFVHGNQINVPCYFIFGDSLVDSGNNNNLDTDCKSDYKPYGIDFPDRVPTGRFTNGKTAADILGELLGFTELIPSYETALSQSKVLKGVNYASASSGILEESGKHWGKNVHLLQQLKNHRRIISRLSRVMNDVNATQSLLTQCLYYFVIGHNDYINNYYLPETYNSSQKYTPEQFAEVLVNQYSQALIRMYSLGARKMGVSGTMPFGCTPHATAFYGTQGAICVDKMNAAGKIFNDKLKDLIHKLGRTLRGSRIAFLNLVDLTNTNLGFNLTLKGCCQVDESGLCSKDKEPCAERNIHPFWDSFHPTEAVNRLSAHLAHTAVLPIL